MKPGRSSSRVRLKTPPASAPCVDGQLLLDQELGILAAFGGTNLDDDGHDASQIEKSRASVGEGVIAR